MVRWLGSGTLSVLLLAAVVAPGAAQTNVSATVSVVSATTGAGVRNLAFGTVPRGATTSRALASAADSTAAGIAHFRFEGLTGTAQVQLTFDFPSTLTRVGGSGTMPVGFDGAGYALRCFDRPNTTQTACTLFNPSPGGADPSAVVFAKTASPYTRLRVYLGGQVSPAASLRAGSYTGTVTVTVTRP